MSKLFIRITIITVALYVVMCYIIAAFLGINIWSQTYYLLFEICTCLCISKQGVYHCKFIKYTAYGILISDALVCANSIFDFLPINWTVYLPPSIISIGLLVTTVLSINHFIKVQRLKKIWKVEEK